jgi:hypothetical protein
MQPQVNPAVFVVLFLLFVFDLSVIRATCELLWNHENNYPQCCLSLSFEKMKKS